MDERLRTFILKVLDDAPDMTIATVRPDGYPQATSVSYVHDAMRIYFGTAEASQKTRNLALCDKVSIAVTCPYRNWGEIRGISLAGTAARIVCPSDMARIGELMFRKFPDIGKYMPLDPKGIALYRVTPIAISVLDYSKGFGHTELVEL